MAASPYQMPDQNWLGTVFSRVDKVISQKHSYFVVLINDL